MSDDTAHCGRRVKNPWWTGITTETQIALFEGARDAHLLEQSLQAGSDCSEQGGR
jgi:hypothetical protein